MRKFLSEKEKIKLHNDTHEKIEELEYLRPKVIAGFIIFWALWILAVVIAFCYYAGIGIDFY